MTGYAEVGFLSRVRIEPATVGGRYKGKSQSGDWRSQQRQRTGRTANQERAPT